MPSVLCTCSDHAATTVTLVHAQGSLHGLLRNAGPGQPADLELLVSFMYVIDYVILLAWAWTSAQVL